MAFDFFTQPRGPEIDINLYPNAASAGINAGNAQKTPLQQVVQGIGTGLDLYGKYQETQIRENQIQQLPIQNQIQETQARNAETIAQINELKLDVATKTQQQELDTAKSQLTAQKAKADEEANSINRKNEFEQTFASMDPDNQVGMIFDGKYNDVFAKNPEVYKRALGAAYASMTPEQKESAAASLDFLRKIELDNQRARINQSFNQKILDNLDKTFEKVSQGPLRGAMQGQSPSEFVGAAQIFPRGVKQFDPKTGEMLEGVTDGPPVPGGGYDLVMGKKRSPYSSIIKDTDYEEFNALQDSYFRFFGKPKEDKTQQQAESPVAKPPPGPKGVNRFAADLKDLGFTDEQAAPVLERAVPELEAGTTRAKEAGFIDRALAAVVPGFIDRPEQMMVGSEGAGSSMRSLIKDSATNLADSTYKKLQEGSPDEKEAVRDWATANGVKPTYSGIKNYYENSIQNSLSASYRDAWNEGIDEKAAQQRTKNATEKINIDAQKALVGKNVNEVLEMRQQTSQAIKPVEITPEHVSERTGLQGKQAAQIAATAKKVAYNPVFDDTPTYVKAVGAVESGGNSMSVSPTGVRGPMQVTKAVAGQYGLNRNIPEQNVQAGQMYLDDLIRTFNGNKELAYAAYNSGPSVVKYAQKLAGGSEDWKDVKKYIYKALQHYEDSIGVNALDKLKEVFNYPERVVTFEQVFA